MQLTIFKTKNEYTTGDEVIICDSTAYNIASEKIEWVLGMQGTLIDILDYFVVKIPEYTRIDGIHDKKLKETLIPEKIYKCYNIMPVLF